MRSPAGRSSWPAPPAWPTCCAGTGRSKRCTTSATSPSPRTPARSAPAPPQASWRSCATWSSGCSAGQDRSTSPLRYGATPATHTDLWPPSGSASDEPDITTDDRAQQVAHLPKTEAASPRPALSAWCRRVSRAGRGRAAPSPRGCHTPFTETLREPGRIRPDPLAAVQPGDRVHLLVAEPQRHRLEVPADSLRRHRPRQGDGPQLQIPREGDSGRVDVVALGDLGDDREQDLDLGLREVAPGLGDDSVLVVVRAEALLLEEWLELDLVDGRHDVAHFGEAAEGRRAEVRDPDAAHQAFALEVDEHEPRLLVQPAARGRPVDQIEIEVVEPELGEARLEGAEGAVAALVVVGDLCRHEQLVARER